MSKKFAKFCWRAGVAGLEIAMVFVIILMLVAGGLLWRIHTAPIDVGFAKTYIEQALRNPESGNYGTMDQLVIHWPDLDGPVLLGMRGVKVIGGNGQTMVSIDEAALSLSKKHLLLGQIAPVSLIVKHPMLQVIRTEQDEFDVGFATAQPKDLMGPPAPIRATEQMALTERILEYIARPGDEEESSPLATLKAFEIQGAHVRIKDNLLKKSWALPRLDVSFRSVAEGLTSDFSLDLPADLAGRSYIQGNVFYDWKTKDLEAVATLRDFEVRTLAQKIPGMRFLEEQDVVLNARFATVLDQHFNPKDVGLIVTSDQGQVLIPDFSPDPVPYQNLELRSQFNKEQKKLAISELRFTTKDVTVKTQADLVYKEDSITGPIRVAIDQVEQEKIGPLWPAALKDDSSKEWIVDKLSEGTFYNLFANIDIAANKIINEQGEETWDLQTRDIEAGFAFDGMNVDYRPPMFPVTDAAGHGYFSEQKDTLSIEIERGKVRDLELKNARVRLDDVVAVGKGSADIHTPMTGPLKTIIEYVSLDPIKMQHEFDLNKIAGDADMVVDVFLPTLKNIKVEDVKVAATGKVDQARMPALVQGLDVTGGPFDVGIKDHKLTVNGSGQLSGRALKGQYEIFLESEGKPYKSKISASLIADTNLRSHFGIDLSDFIEGSAPISLVYTEFQDGRSEADVNVDLKPLRVFVEPFGYEKAIGAQGSAKLKTYLQNGAPTEIVGLNITAPRLNIERGRLIFRGRGKNAELAQGKIPKLLIDETSGNLDFEIEPSGRMKFILDAQYLDLRPFLDDENKKETYDSPPVLISVSADRIRTDEEETISRGKIYADIDNEGRFNQLEMDALAGQGAIYLRFKPDSSGMRTFRFEADDAGAALKAFGIYDKIVGGKMVVYGEPIRGVYDRNIVGVAEITAFKVVDAPALAQLLSAMSLGSILTNLNQDGLFFEKLEASFDWLYRSGGGLLVLKDGRTSGNSLGLTFDGTFNKAEGTVDVSGTIIPLSGINKIIGSIPLLGDIITGGTGSLIAATYKIEGAAKEPDISVNPLSVLTPGILRRILFEN